VFAGLDFATKWSPMATANKLVRVKFMALVGTWRSNNFFLITFAVKKLCRFTSDITRKYRLVIHRWICLDLLITEQCNLLKSDKNCIV
jgi:hypothetical protein